MVFTFYFALSWVMLGLLMFNRQESRASRMEILFLVLLTCLINTHTYLGLFETFKWMKTTITPKLYVAFLLFRSVFTPLFVTYITLHLVNKTWKNTWSLFLLYCLVIIGIDKINISADLYHFKKWNYFSTLTYYLLYLFFTMLSYKGFQGLEGKEGKNVDEVGR